MRFCGSRLRRVCWARSSRLTSEGPFSSQLQNLIRHAREMSAFLHLVGKERVKSTIWRHQPLPRRTLRFLEAWRSCDSLLKDLLRPAAGNSPVPVGTRIKVNYLAVYT